MFNVFMSPLPLHYLKAECKFKTEIKLSIGLKPNYCVQIKLSYKTFSLKLNFNQR